ncbi:UDP-N-acetylmuramate dehydrogenase [Lachnospiraceae bacterium PM6-15]|uniref:FAD-binding protein n=1 Tax=Ohessyouella blattaphilus TaxID=2949333 RepID=UPI003E2326DB
MQTLYNVYLNQYTTFQLGGICKTLFIPETESELINLVMQDAEYKFIGGGSNLLINDRAVYDNVILLKKFSDSITIMPGGHVDVSASISLAKLIRTINQNGLGGIEYLASVPGLVGGALYMNAGRGKRYNVSIADYVVSVRALCLTNSNGYRRGEILELNKNKCEFAYRNSIFKNNHFLILSAKFDFDTLSLDEAKKHIEERMEWCKKTQDRSRPNFGSVFREQNGIIMNMVRILQLGGSRNVHFSRKSKNWMLNPMGKDARVGAFDDAVRLINRVKKIHKLFRKKCTEEVCIWR